MSARKSMTLRFYAQTSRKRVDGIALVDCGATENFMNLDYAKWLGCNIKKLPSPRHIINVDGTENKSGHLQFYTDLSIQTGPQRTNHRFFLTNLGDHKTILGYPWFASSQPRIDWARGWIDSTQLPIIFRTEDYKRAQFPSRLKNVPKVRKEQKEQIYCIVRRVEDIPQGVNPFNIVPENLAKIPKCYHNHLKVFSEAKAR